MSKDFSVLLILLLIILANLIWFDHNINAPNAFDSQENKHLTLLLQIAFMMACVYSTFLIFRRIWMKTNPPKITFRRLFSSSDEDFPNSKFEFNASFK